MSDFFSKSIINSWDKAILNSVAETRKYLPITTQDRLSLIKLARSLLLEKITHKKSLITNHYNNFSFKQSVFVFVTLLNKEKTICCLGSSMQEENLFLTVKNIVKEMLMQIAEKKLNLTAYFEIELLFDEELDTSKFNLGLHAVRLVGTDYYFKSSVPIKKQWEWDELVDYLYQKASINESNSGFASKISLFKTMVFREIPISPEGAELQDLYRHNELFLHAEITKVLLLKSLHNAQKYLQYALLKDINKIIYCYKPISRKKIPPQNISEWIRIFASLWALLETSHKLDVNIILQIRAFLDHTMNDQSIFEQEKIVDLGTNALITLCEQLLGRYESNAEYFDKTQFLSSFIESNGSFYTYFTDNKYYKGDEHQYFLPFMAMIALLREGNKEYLDKISTLCLPFYLSFYKNSTPEKQLAMSMWLCRVLFEIYQHIPNEYYVEILFNICDFLCSWQNYFLDENIDLLGTFTHDFTTCTTAVVLESLGIGLMFVANKDESRYKKYQESILLGMRFLMQMQYTHQNCFNDHLIGGFRFSPFNPEIRVDVVQHAVFAISNLLHAEKLS